MTQTRTELILQAVTALVTLSAPLLYFYLPNRTAEVDIWVQVVQGVIAVASVVALNWGVASFIKTRSEERQFVQAVMGANVESDGQGGTSVSIAELEFRE